MESYQKVTVSELCQNLVPDFSAASDPSSSNKFFITRYNGEGEEFRTRIKHVWIQGHVINVSADGDVIEIADEADVARTVESVIVETDKVNEIASIDNADVALKSSSTIEEPLS